MSDLSTLTIFPQQSCLVSPPAVIHLISPASHYRDSPYQWASLGTCSLILYNSRAQSMIIHNPLSLNYTFTPCQIISYLQIMGNQQESMNLQAKSWVQFSTNPQLCPTGYSSGYIVSYSGYSKCQKNMHK